MGATAAAGEDAREVVRLSGAAPEVMAALSAVTPEEAVRRVLATSLRRLAARDEREYVSPVRFAELHAALGQDEEALRWLARAAEDRAPALAYSVGDPVFDGLRGRPAFQRIAERVEGGGVARERPALTADLRR
jgi:hypothetical protein